MMASSAFHAGHPEVAEIETAYHTLTPLLGAGAAGVFLLSLIVSGISASTVGTMAGQLIMQGFVGFRIPVWVRRLVTMLPAFVVVAIGVNATNALVISQVVLSIALPLPMIALIIFTGRRDIMGGFVNGKVTRVGRAGRRRRRADAEYGADRAGHRPADTRPLGCGVKPSAGLGASATGGDPPQSGFQIKLFQRSMIFSENRLPLFRIMLEKARPRSRSRLVIAQTVFRFSAADLPVLRSTTTSNATRWPSRSSRRPARSTALIWTNTSLPPPSGWINP